MLLTVFCQTAWRHSFIS